MKLIKSFESKGVQNQSIEISCEVNGQEEIDGLGYRDFKANLYLDGRHIADISTVLNSAGLLHELIDSIGWREIYAETINDLKQAV